MEPYITFIASAFEALTIYLIMKILSKENSMPIYKVAIFIFLTSIGITIVDAIEITYQFLYTLLIYIVTLMILSRKKTLLLLTDLLMASGCFVFMQLMATIIIGYLDGNVLENYYLLFITLFLFAAITYGIGNYVKIGKPIERFYADNRDIVVWVSVNIFVTILITLHLWNDQLHIFWKVQYDILILISIIYILNGGLLMSFLHKKRQREKIKGYQEYGKYLEVIMNQLSSRQHEFANQINVMVGLAQTKKDEKLSLAIIEYGERILDEKKRAANETIICDDSIIAAMLYQKKSQAKKEQIQFEYLIEKPFPKFSASAYDLVELIVNLINNAFEAVSTLEVNERQVFLKINTGSIEVINTVQSNFDHTDIAKFSQMGYSTKGQQRGYGISNIKTIINRYNGQFDIYSQDNMIIFYILLP